MHRSYVITYLKGSGSNNIERHLTYFNHDYRKIHRLQNNPSQSCFLFAPAEDDDGANSATEDQHFLGHASSPAHSHTTSTAETADTPLKGGAKSTDSISTAEGGGVQPLSAKSKAEFIRQKNPFKESGLKWPCGLTNFHFSLIIGIAGFFIFWLLLLLRIYLPGEYFA